ncbi:MAG: hypothetical protein A2202_01940 [Bdellovibrionales bacterium RIFOXYA1_FULL_36_14]|nr:MAG: hypothetical protein A2202_01940 [Bdellovibrionales bacterium RIFOXYA1_FULL_36_14]
MSNKYFIFFIIFLFIGNVCALEDNSSFSVLKQFGKDNNERYIRLEKALRNIKPESIIKIIIAFTYTHGINKLNNLPPLPGVAPDLKFYQNLFPYVEDTFVITDDSEMNKTDLLNQISKKISNPNKQVVILMYSGHGGSQGEIFLGSYTKQCKNYFHTNIAGKDYTNVTKGIFLQPPLRTNISDFWGMNCSNYVLSPSELVKTLQNKKVIFLNDSCHSGIYDQWMGSPLKMLIYGAKADGYAIEYNPHSSYDYLNPPKIVPKGSHLNLELKKRLLPEEGCRYDGLDPNNASTSKDLVLNLYEWTINLSNAYQLPPPQKLNLKQNYNPVLYTSDHQVLALPVMVYLGNECKNITPINLQTWNDLDHQSRQFSSTIKNTNQVINTNLIFQLFSSGQY